MGETTNLTQAMVWISKPQHEALRHYCYEHRISKSKVIRELIDELLQKQNE